MFLASWKSRKSENENDSEYYADREYGEDYKETLCMADEQCLYAGKNYRCHPVTHQCKPSFGPCDTDKDCFRFYDLKMEESECVTTLGQSHVCMMRLHKISFNTSSSNDLLSQRKTGQTPVERKDPKCGENFDKIRVKAKTNTKVGVVGHTIKASVVIEDSLWEEISTVVGGGDPTREIVKQLENLFEGVNKHLVRLDNGGFMVDFDHNITKLGESSINFKSTYVDRQKGNITKEFDNNDIFAHTYAFQEAVQELPDRNAVDIRILVISERNTTGKKQSVKATAEENCICNPNWFGCIAVFSIKLKNDWSYHQTIFAHEIGHSLGMDVHDDEFYTADMKDKLLMWSSVNRGAFIWSAEARKRISRHDNSCLCKRIGLLRTFRTVLTRIN